MRSIRAVTAGFCALAAGLLIGACGGSNSSSTTTVTRTRAAHTTPTPTGTGTSSTGTTSTSGTTGTTSSTTTAAVTPACTAPMLALSEIGNQGATGHIEVGLALKNTSSHSCHTYGYPGVLFLGKTGQALKTVAARTTTDFAGHIPLQRLVVAPGGTVSFRLLFQDTNQGTNVGCTTAYGVQVIPPDDTQTLRTTIPHGVPECGTTSVSPLAPGTTAYR